MTTNRFADLRRLAGRSTIVAAVLAAIAVLIALMAMTVNVLLLVFAGLLFAVLLSAAADALAGVTRMPRGAALAAVVVTMLLALVGASMALWPSLSEQVDELVRQLPAAMTELRGWMEGREWGRWLLGRAEPGRVIEDSAVMDQATGVLMSSFSALTALVVILFVGLYVAAQPELYHRGVRSLVPPGARPRFDAVVFEIVGVLRWWLLGTLLSMTIVGVLTTLGLWWLGVPLALAFGVLAALLTFIPNFGPVISVLPPTLIALADQPGDALWVLGLYGAIQIVESYAITPLIQRRTVAMPPALTIIAQVILGLLVGPIGVVVATPVTAVAMTAIERLYVQDLLEASELTHESG